MVTPRVDREELAWAAGFFDGEGHMRAGFRARSDRSKTRRWRYVCIDVSQNDRAPLDRFQAAVGGVGSIYGPYKYGKAKNPMYHFSTQKFEDVQAIIAMLWFKLGSIKRSQARQALANYKEAITHDAA